MKKVHLFFLVLLFVMFVSCDKKEPSANFEESVDGHECIDLGLSVKWATCNLGATKSTEFGDYYLWADTVPYNSVSSTAYNYTTDPCSADKVLYYMHDAVTHQWGHSWRMPTYNEMSELKTQCSWTFTENYNNSNVSGYIVKSNKNGNSIFLPSASYIEKGNQVVQNSVGAYYWTASGQGDVAGDLSVPCLQATSPLIALLTESNRANGLTIRGVVGAANTAQADIYVHKPSGSLDGYEYVDLGLSVKWATCNVGASTPYAVGDYFAWQEVTPWNEYTYMNYSKDLDVCCSGNILSRRFDAAAKNMSISWRMPTREEIKELISECDWRLVYNVNGTEASGFIVVSKKNGNTIFLPAGKYKAYDCNPQGLEGHYWSSHCKGEVTRSIDASSLFFALAQGGGVHYDSDKRRYDGLTIRAVVGEAENCIPEADDSQIDTEETQRQGYTVNGKIGGHTYVNLGLPSGTLWATYDLGTTLPTAYGNYYAWGETSTKSYYDQSTYKYYIGNSTSDMYKWAQYSKYVVLSLHGTPDYKVRLEAQDDAATVNWGENWCMPTQSQLQELIDYCNVYREDVVVEGEKVNGMVCVSKINNNKIYFSLAGWLYKNVPVDYLTMWRWSSDLAINNTEGTDYRAFYLSNGTDCKEIVILDGNRYQGLPIRAVVKQ